ncbi:hypothetical protein [Agrobacterium tomkonis]|uniref:hypothetical protein n=1 Tax=Agrobacterium tomkonis TaxID=1183410 RepID=UPI001CD87CA1
MSHGDATPPPHHPSPYAAATTDHTGCVHIGAVKGIEAIAAAGSKGPTEVVYLYAGPAPSPQTHVKGYQERVAAAHHALFHDDPTDIEERRARFAEEVNETLQAFGMTEGEAIELVRYTWSRPVGQPEKEVGAALLTLASLCVVAGIDMAACGEADLEKLQRPETIARIRAKRSTRHGRGPLPGLDPALATEGKVSRRECGICEGPHDNDMLTDICTDCETRINEEGSP